MIIESSALTFAHDVVASPTPVLAHFFAESSDPCKKVTSILTQLVEKNTAALKVVQINFDSNPGLTQELNVATVPTVKLFIGGRVLYTFTGEKPLPELISELSEFVERLRQ